MGPKASNPSKIIPNPFVWFRYNNYGESSQNKDSSRWGDVYGVPANCFTDKTERTSQLLAGFDQQTWEFLEEGLDSLPSHKPGIYFLNDLPRSGAD